MKRCRNVLIGGLLIVVPFAAGYIAAIGNTPEGLVDPVDAHDVTSLPKASTYSAERKLSAPIRRIYADETALDSSSFYALAREPKCAANARAIQEQLIALAKRDPHAALRLARRVRPTSERLKAITEILHTWAGKEPENAWAWASEHSQNDLPGLLKEIAKVDTELAWDYTRKYVAENPEQLQIAYTKSIQGLMHKGAFSKALDLVDGETIPVTPMTNEGKYSFIEDVIAEWARFNPEEAAAWIAALPAGSSPRKSLAYKGLLSSWAIAAPDDVLRFAEELPESPERTATQTIALAEWIQQDVTAAAEWLNQRDEVGSEFDWNIYAIATASEVVRQDPEIAIGWAQSIKAPDVREDGLVNVLADWMVNDFDQASRYLQENVDLLSLEAQQKVIRVAHGRLDGMGDGPSDGDDS